MRTSINNTGKILYFQDIGCRGLQSNTHPLYIYAFVLSALVAVLVKFILLMYVQLFATRPICAQMIFYAYRRCTDIPEI